MKFSTMSPAERMKASGLVGLIIVVLFFVVHTMLGSVSPKPKDKQGGNAAAAQGVPAPPPPASGAAAPGTQVEPQDAFPLDKAKATRNELDRNVPDPFVQIRGDHTGRPEVGGRPGHRETPIDVKPSNSGFAFGMKPRGGLPTFGNAFGGSGTQGPAQVVVQKPAEPEIRLIGLVYGDNAVATLSVDGAIQIARPGDPVAKGYRLIGISEQGVTIKHDREFVTLRTGMAMNTPEKK